MSQSESHGFYLYWYLNDFVINKIIVVDDLLHAFFHIYHFALNYLLAHFFLSINKGKQDLYLLVP
jgi:hypothetical protein